MDLWSKQLKIMKYLTYTNSGCIDLCRNMVTSLKQVGVDAKNISIHCFDKISMKSLADLDCQLYTWKELSDDLTDYQEWSFDPSSSFSKIVSWKWKIIKNFYNNNKEFIFTDTDIVYKKNVENDLKSYGKNICIQCDTPGSLYCTGFMYFKESPEATTIINSCANNHMDDQIIFNRNVNELGLRDKICLLPQDKYPNGHVFYKTEIDKSNIAIIHNNHMLGKENKINMFKKYGNWFV
jgi:hypothetical protein